MSTHVPLLSRDQIDRLPERARDVVEYRKSGLSLNHIQGCPLDCAYCIRRTVISDRYIPSGLVMQRFDGIDPAFLWQVNAEADRPDLAVILEADPEVIAERLTERGPHNRFQLSPGSSHAEVHFYRQATERLIRAGFDVLRVDCNQLPVGQSAAVIRVVLSAFRVRRELPDDVDAAAQVRLGKQGVLYKGGHTFAVVLEESVLRYQIGDVRTMVGQLEHLLSVASLPSLSLGIIPQRADRSVLWPVEMFYLYDNDQARTELVSGQLTITQPREVVMYAKVFNQLSAMAVYGAEAKALIVAALEARCCTVGRARAPHGPDHRNPAVGDPFDEDRV